MKNKAEIVRSVYLYLVSLTGVLMIVLSIISVSNNLLNYFFREGQEFGWLINSALSSAAYLIAGVFFFSYHWKLIIKEKRIGRRTEVAESESKMNLFESIFFYALSYAGLMIFAVSLSGFLSSFAYVKYLESPTPEGGYGYTSTAIEINYKHMIQSIIAMAIGITLWIIAFLHCQRSYSRDSKDVTQEKNEG